mmetsp:Transcript_9054/g.28825  ORF Transcript_9054/g.28825 Transcript_9054/m.28825 type:complete len:633 (+) Transcript_9054:118-2016(+)
MAADAFKCVREHARGLTSTQARKRPTSMRGSLISARVLQRDRRHQTLPFARKAADALKRERATRQRRASVRACGHGRSGRLWRPPHAAPASQPVVIGLLRRGRRRLLRQPRCGGEVGLVARCVVRELGPRSRGEGRVLPVDGDPLPCLVGEVEHLDEAVVAALLLHGLLQERGRAADGGKVGGDLGVPGDRHRDAHAAEGFRGLAGAHLGLHPRARHHGPVPRQAAGPVRQDHREGAVGGDHQLRVGGLVVTLGEAVDPEGVAVLLVLVVAGRQKAGNVLRLRVPRARPLAVVEDALGHGEIEVGQDHVLPHLVGGEAPALLHGDRPVWERVVGELLGLAGVEAHVQPEVLLLGLVLPLAVHVLEEDHELALEGVAAGARDLRVAGIDRRRRVRDGRNGGWLPVLGPDEEGVHRLRHLVNERRVPGRQVRLARLLQRRGGGHHGPRELPVVQGGQGHLLGLVQLEAGVGHGDPGQEAAEARVRRVEGLVGVDDARQALDGDGGRGVLVGGPRDPVPREALLLHHERQHADVQALLAGRRVAGRALRISGVAEVHVVDGEAKLVQAESGRGEFAVPLEHLRDVGVLHLRIRQIPLVARPEPGVALGRRHRRDAGSQIPKRRRGWHTAQGNKRA